MLKDLTIALQLINNDITKIDENKYESIYRLTNENQTNLSYQIQNKNSKISTVLGSGDQVFNLLLNNIINIDTFDINILTKYYFELKKAAILSISYEDYLNFFFPKNIFINTNLFSNKYYSIIRTNINNQDALYFWDYLFNHYNGDILYYSNLFKKEKNNKNAHKKYNPYLNNKTNYNKVKKNLKKLNYNYEHLNILDSNLKLNNKYSFVYLSNIFDYIKVKTEKEYIHIIKEVLNNLFKYIYDESTIICYLFQYLEYEHPINEIETLCSELIRYKYFEDMYTIKDFKSLYFINSNNPKNMDAYMIYKKKLLKGDNYD